MHKYYFLFSDGSKINQILCALLINLLVFAYGLCTGWISPMTFLLQSKHSPRTEPLTDVEVSWIAAISHLVGIPSYYAMAYLGDRMGRKLTLMFTSSTCAALWILKLSSVETWALVTSRALVGISMAGSYVTCPVYTKEISEDCVRGILGTLVILFQSTGNLVMFIMGDLLGYYTVLWICLSIPVIHILLFTWMPESPSYLVKHGRLEEATKAVAWLRCKNQNDADVVNELERIKREQESDEGSGRFVIKAICKDKILFKAFVIAISVCLAREFCGMVTVFNFASDIFSKASKGVTLTPNQQAMLIGAVPVCGALVASILVERAGRKPLLFTTSLISGITMSMLASWFIFQKFNLFAPDWLPVVILCVCIFSDAAGLLPMSVVIIGEIFSFKYRATVFASTMAAASLLDFFLLLFFKPIAASIGVYVVFYFFGITCLLNAVYVLICIPETKMRSIEEIYQDLG